MVDRISTLGMHSRIDSLNEEAKTIRERYAGATSQERVYLEARYGELEQELKSLKAKLSEVSSLVLSRAPSEIGAPGSGPFGISMGMRIDDLEAKSESIGHGKYRFSTVPKPHSAFESYIIQSSPHCGISWVKGIGKTTSTSRYGTELRLLFDEMKSRLEKVYGSRNDMTDRLMPDSIWNEMGDWMVALQKKERHLSVLWGGASGALLPHDLEHVFLYATALDDESGYIAIEYSFVNSSACDEELAALEDDVL